MNTSLASFLLSSLRDAAVPISQTFSFLKAFKDLNLSAASIARKFHVSDTYVLKVFDRFVNMKRLPLGEILSVDEVHLKIPGECEYALVLFDFTSRQPIDMIPSRRQSVTFPTFASIVDTKVGKVRPSNSPTESLNRRPKNQRIKKQWP